ncbi:hypothetical protein M9979_08010 [Sphingomonas sp. RP10(2022)]|uniref:DUF4145 domain-containing protein n=1 Tax=Sphingomonas liriopis TaxID=2949094 RepID=A0A9X2HPL4_9SPHN|nr:hypothetical protein [Sphingomonas liriopis]MCP3734813.1 hypothetical protein [Sphingomonas liriopis]
MAINVDRFKNDLDALIEQGDLLKVGMILDMKGKKYFRENVFGESSDDEAAAAIKRIPEFKTEYESWYSESLALLRQLLPDRINDFRALYEKPKSRKNIEYGNYVIQDYMQNLAVTTPYGETKVDRSAAEPQFNQQVAILKSAKKRFESSIFEIRQLVQADLFDSEIEASLELFKNGFLRAAGAIAGVVIERHLKQVCDDHNIKITKANPGIAVLNQALRDGNVIDIPQWRFNQHIADIRNICDHSKSQDPTKEQVQDLIDGTKKILKTVA